MSAPFLLGTDILRKIQSVRPQNLVSLWPQNEPAGGISTEIVRQYNGAYTGVTLGQPGVPGSGLTSAGYDGVTSYNDIYTAGFANDNLLLNPGFETAGAMPPVWANWLDTIGDGAIANEVVIVHEGTDSAKLTSGATSNTSTRQNFVVVPGVRRRFRFWTQGDGANDGRYRIRDVTAGADIIPITATGVTGAAWGMVAVEYTVPAGCIAVAEWFLCPDVNGGIAYFDACEDRRMDGFLGDQGTVIVPAQVANAGVWTDGIGHYVFHFQTDVNNRLFVTSSAVNNRLDAYYIAGGVALSILPLGYTTIDWLMLGVTWSATDDAFRFYVDGVEPLAGVNGLGTWVGNLQAALSVIGARSTVPATPYLGNIAYAPVWSDALSPDEMRYLGTP